MGGAYLFVGRDRAYRDVDPVQGTYRIVAETKPAIRLIRETLKTLRVVGVTWWLDAHVSNVGRLKTQLSALAPASLGWQVQVCDHVDHTLECSDTLVASSDSDVLDRAVAWCSLEQAVHARHDGQLNVRDLRLQSEHPFP